ncbi:MAG: hypothetical protein JO154_07395 [Chitinophaga sp.]|uniref:hypothetical protein n=1 Tax=Chitinophaga sp. TaxID=1869181 RepID=UPI0025BE91ED|nr:hypothetical protein [Chitinophaga sp.]MBV8252417.1 hypothetical protein [Chitinophaga sp.]
MTTFHQQDQKVNTQMNVGNMIFHVYATPDVTSLVEKAIKSVQQSRYADALKLLDTILQADDSIADAFYYRALANLNGKRPKFATKSIADRIDPDLATAITLNSTQAHYYYLRALVKHDFYLGNGFTADIGDIQKLINQAARCPVDKPKCKELLQHTNAANSEVIAILLQRL